MLRYNNYKQYRHKQGRSQIKNPFGQGEKMSPQIQ